MKMPNPSLFSRCACWIATACTILTLNAEAQGTVTAGYSSVADVPVTSNNYTATGNSVNFTLNFAPPVGTTLKVVENTGLGFISGEFSNVSQGQVVTLTHASRNYEFVANYYGGTGNDLELVWKRTRLIGWGAGGKQLGFEPTTNLSINIPAVVDTPTGQLSGRTILRVAGGSAYTMVLCSDGRLLAWGEGFYGTMGNGTTTAQTLPQLVPQTGAPAGKTVATISAGDKHVLALCTDGSVLAWGWNQYGHLGDGSTTLRSSPVLINGGALAGKTVVAISAGEDHSLALCSDGTLAAWGFNANGRLGVGDTTNRTTPTLVPVTGALAGKTIVSIGAGGAYSAVLCSDGSVVTWGNNQYGQLGSGGSHSLVPVLVNTAAGSALQGKAVKALSTGTTNALVLCTDGTLAAWGIFGGDGQDASTRNYIPVAVNMSGVLSGKTVGAIQSRTNHHTVLCTDGTAVAWGEGSEGSMGDGSNTARLLPVLVNTSALAPDDRIMSLSKGTASFCNFATVGFSGLPDIALTPVGGSSLISGVSTLAFGTEELTFSKPISVTMRNTGSGPLDVSNIAISGANAADFAISGITLPLNILAGTSVNFVVSFTPSSAAAHSATLTVTSTDFDESPFIVALTGTGQALATTPLNASYTTGAEVPVTAATYTAAGRAINLTFNYQPAVGSKLTVINNTGLNFIRGAFTNLRQGQPVTISYNGLDYHFVANYFGGTGNDLELLWATNRLAAWGYSADHLGVTPAATGNLPTPRAVGQPGGPMEGKAILSVTSGFWHSVALLADGTLLSWGLNQSGMLGNGTTNYGEFPAPVDQTGVLAGKRVVAIAAGNVHTLALTSDGLVAAWGANGSGQLGDGTTTPRNAPVLVNTLGALAGKFVVGISAGYTHSLALCSDGTVVAWGEGTSGQMGNGGASSSPVPVTVTVTGTALEGRTPIQVSAGTSHCMALCSDGTAVSWGSNSYGQLGISPSANPVYLARAVFTGAGSALQGKTLKSISSGAAEATGLCTDGTLVAWGLFSGNGNAGSETIPVLVSAATALSGKTIVAHSARSNNKSALCSDGSLVGWGYNAEGGVGDGTFDERVTPAALATSVLLPGEKFSSVAQAATSAHGLAVIASPQTVEIVVEQPADTSLTDGSATVAYGSVLVNTTATKTFTIKNTGNTYLTGLTIAIDGTDADDFDVTTAPVSPVIAGASTTFVLTFKPTTLGAKTAALHISSNDADEDPFDIALTATSFGIPEIDVQEVVGTSDASGSTIAFGNAITGTAKLKTFTIVNTGSGVLSGLNLSVSAGDFNVDAPLGATSLAPGASTTFRMKFQPGSAGAATGTLDIASNDDNENPYRLNFTGNGVLVSAAEIQVFHKENSDFELTDNTGSVLFGNTELGYGKTYTFTIRNSGTANLTGLALSKTGTNAADFTLGTLSTTTLGFEATTEFTVVFLPGALGARTATIRVASNDANENPFDIILTGAGATPEIDISLPGPIAVADAGSVNFGMTQAVGVPVTRTFTLRNLGTSPLAMNGCVIDGVNAAEFVTNPIPLFTTLAAGASLNFDVTFTPSTFGPRTAALHIVSNDSNENPYDITLTGTAVGPEISVEQPAATVLVDGASSINFGPAVQPAFVARTFTVKNPGTTTLSGIAASFIGPDAANFSITTAPPATVAAKGTTTFIARFTPNDIRVFNATLRIVSNDFDENPFDIEVTGEGVVTLNPSFDVHPVSQIIALGQPVTFSAVVDSPTAFTSQWRKGNATFANIAGATSTSYTIPAVKLTDAAFLYRMKATNPAGNTDSNTAALTVVDRTAKTFNLAALAKATFTASAATTTGSTLTYRWLKDGADLPVDARYVVAPANQLVINTLEAGDAATYTCEVTGPGGSLESGDNVLTVFDSAPVIIPNPTFVMDEGIVSGDYSFFIPLDPTKGTPSSYTATPLPAGLKFNTATGEFTGKPTTAKVSPPYSITVTAKNSMGTSTATGTLIVRPLTAGADGDYLGIIDRGPVNDNLGGRFELKVTPTGSYTGKIFLGTKSYPFPAGNITATAGSSLVTGIINITRAPLPALAVSFTINTLTKRVTLGAVSSAGLGSSSFTGWKNTWNATTQATDYDDYYTFSLDVPLPLVGDEDIPQGLGFGSFKVPAKGESFTIAGRTADGDSFISSSFLGPNGDLDLAIYDDLSAKGSLVGILKIIPGTGPSLGQNSLTGSPTWSRPADPAVKATTYKAGFNAFSLIVTGGRYVPPASNGIVLGKPTPAVANNAGLAFFDGGIGGPPSRADRRVSLIPGTSLTIAASGLTQTNLKISTATGAFSGDFTLLDTHPVTPGAARITRKPTYQGMIVPTPAGPQGHGFFLLQQLPTATFPPPPALPVLSGGVILE